MKVVFFISFFEIGGLERSTIRLAEEVVRRGGEAVLVTLHGNGEMLPQWPDSASVRVLDRAHAFMAIPALAKVMRNEEMDAFISATDHANIVAVLARMLSRKKFPLILTERLSLREVMKSRGWFRRVVLSRLRSWAYPRAEAIVANSQDGAREVESLLGWSSGQVHSIYNPTVSDSISELAEEEVDDPWFKHGAVPVVLGLGRLEERKDFATLVRAVAIARASVECRLVIFGGGELQDSLTQLSVELGVGEHVRFEPFEHNPYKYLSRASLYVHSSRSEGLPNALIEAQACGIPTISTDCPTGPREILEDGKSGVLVPVGDHVEMARAISEVLLDKDLAKKYVASSNEGLLRFKPVNAYAQYKKLIDQVSM
jgi:glycosyltransferase involved in cell wall biosynthesis